MGRFLLDSELLSFFVGARDGTVVRALASHQCGPGSNPGLNAICGLSLLLVLSFAPRGFSPGSPVFPSPQKPTFPNSNSTRNQVDEEPLCGCATSKSLFIYFIYLFHLFIYFDISRISGRSWFQSLAVLGKKEKMNTIILTVELKKLKSMAALVRVSLLRFKKSLILLSTKP